MDRNYYYRILGLRNDATPAQIDQAYRARMARLGSADYADDAEYVKKKKMQAKHAYEVLIGASAPCSDGVKERRFERYKDRIEAREGLDSDDFLDDGTSERHVKRQRKAESMAMEFDSFADSAGTKVSEFFGKLKPKRKSTSRKAKATSFGNSGGASKKLTIGIVASIMSVLIGMSSIVGLLIGDDISYDDYDYSEEVIAAMNEAEGELIGADYEAYLDKSTMTANAANIDWDSGVAEYNGDVNGGTGLILTWLDIYDNEIFYSQVTGYDEYYYENDDYDCAMTLIAWLGAPAFEEVAGSTNTFTNEPILSLADYMDYLADAVWEITADY